VDYSPQIQQAMGSKGLWRYLEGTVIAPKLYALLVNGVSVLSDGKTPASEEQIKARETQIIDFQKCEYFMQPIILSTTSTCLGVKIKDKKMDLKEHFKLMFQQHNNLIKMG
jgi:hypothetical protein